MPILLQAASQCESKDRTWSFSMGPFIFQLHEVTCLVFPQAPKQAGAMSSSVLIQEPDPKQHTTALDRFHRAHATWLLIKQPAAFTSWATISEVTRDLFSTLPAIAIRRSQEPLSFRNPNKDFLSSQTLGGDSRTKREAQIPHLPLCHCVTKQQLASVTCRVTSHIRTLVGTDDARWQLVGLPSASWESYCVWRWLTE